MTGTGCSFLVSTVPTSHINPTLSPKAEQEDHRNHRRWQKGSSLDFFKIKAIVLVSFFRKCWSLIFISIKSSSTINYKWWQESNKKMRCAWTACEDSLLHIHPLHSQSNTVFSLRLLVSGFHCHFELCVKITKILEEGTNSRGKKWHINQHFRKEHTWCKAVCKEVVQNQALSGWYQRLHVQTWMA